MKKSTFIIIISVCVAVIIAVSIAIPFLLRGGTDEPDKLPLNTTTLETKGNGETIDSNGNTTAGATEVNDGTEVANPNETEVSPEPIIEDRKIPVHNDEMMIVVHIEYPDWSEYAQP